MTRPATVSAAAVPLAMSNRIDDGEMSRRTVQECPRIQGSPTATRPRPPRLQPMDSTLQPRPPATTPHGAGLWRGVVVALVLLTRGDRAAGCEFGCNSTATLCGGPVQYVQYPFFAGYADDFAEFSPIGKDCSGSHSMKHSDDSLPVPCAALGDVLRVGPAETPGHARVWVGTEPARLPPYPHPLLLSC